jgi:hypothetical protein
MTGMKAFRQTASAAPAAKAVEALRAQEVPGSPWHRWLLIVSAIGYLIYLSTGPGYLQLLLLDDPTFLTPAVAVLFLIATSYIGMLAWELSQQHDALLAHLAGAPMPARSWTGDFLRERATLGGRDATPLGDLLHERIKGRTELGWFSAGLHIKLGLLGTVIGFVMMLASVGSANELQAQGIDTLIRGMGTGMRVSLYHTIAGLVGSILIGFQMLAIDRAADRLFALIITLPESSAPPAADRAGA